MLGAAIFRGHNNTRNPRTLPLDESVYGTNRDPQNVVDEMEEEELSQHPWGDPERWQAARLQAGSPE